MEKISPLFVSCCGLTGGSGLGTGGLVCIYQGQPIVLDSLESTGICFDQGLLFRYIRLTGTIVAYDQRGLCYTLRVRDVDDIHDILVEGNQFLCVCTSDNEIRWLDPLGRVLRRWVADGSGDAWHLNCVCKVNGRYYVSAFGEFREHRGWVGGNTLNNGFVFDLESQERILTGYSGPHNPRLIDNRWFVCDSHKNCLAVDEPDGSRKCIDLGGFTRGLTYDDDYIYVGTNAHRSDPQDKTARIHLLDRKTLELCHIIPLPFPEVYDFVIVPAELAAAACANPGAFEVNPENDRIAGLQRQIEVRQQTIYELRERLKHRGPLRRFASTLKRNVLGAGKRLRMSARSS